MKGKFITFEGPEGSGKSTQIAKLARRLRDRGRKVLCTREPGGTRTGEAIRNILQHDAAGEPICAEAETLLFAASRAQLVNRVILPALKKGTCVLCDRFADSTTVYQGFGRGLDAESISVINSFAIDGAVPNLTILLDVDVKKGFARLGKRNCARNTGRDRIEREKRSFHERVRSGYLKLAKRERKRFAVIDANRNIAAVETDVWKVVEKLIREP